jgi:acetyltransferase-like isoleucine patch superfamily enzyme
MKKSHRDRLAAAGVDLSSLDRTEYALVTDGFPQWWHDAGNALYFAPGAKLPAKVLENFTVYPVYDALIVIGSDLDWLTSLLIGGDRATVFVGRGCAITAGELYCGGDSSIVLQGKVLGTRSAVVDARNGGSIVAGRDQLWAANVYIATDDMHRLEDATTGERLNPFGAHIRLGSHVWLCKDVAVTGHVQIGDGSVVGMRSVVRGQKIAANTVCVGTPARVVREGATWSHDDLP